MDLRAEFLTALRRGDDHDTLLESVHQALERGLAPRQAYNALHQLWLDLGFNRSDEESALRDNLEYVMEKIWYECPAEPR
jgi:hypothetical protein